MYADALDYLNMIFTGVFTVEFILKLTALGFKVNYFISSNPLAENQQPPGKIHLSRINEILRQC